MKHLAYLNKFFYKYRYRLIPGILFVVISNVFMVLPAKIISFAFNLVQENIDFYRLFNGFSRQYLLYDLFGKSLLLFGAIVLALSLLRGIFLFLMRQTIILMSRHIEYDLKNELYAHYQSLSASFYRKNNTGDLMNRVTEDVSRVRMYLGPAIMYTVNTIVLFILTIYAMVRVNTELAIYCVLPFPFLVLTIYYVNNTINSRSEQIQRQLSGLSSFVQETFAGIRVVKSYGMETGISSRFAAESESYRGHSMALAKIQALFFPLMILLVGFSATVTIYAGGVGVMKGTITPGNIAEFMVYITQLTFPVTMLGWVTSLIQRAAASQKRINEFLQTEPDIASGSEQRMIEGRIEFRNVSFTYPETGIGALKNVSFTVEPGEFLAVIGRTGSGKSTLADLLMRMYDVTSGEIFVDGIPINHFELHTYRKQIGFVPQDVFLFSDTIANNIAFGNLETAKSRIESAAKDAAVYDNIIQFSEGFETVTGERGITLSGGQKQRISIARALATDPRILILDDSLSAVDTATEEEILKNLGKNMRGKTSVIISHRISTIRNASLILVMDEGRIVEEGTHESLLEQQGLYREIYEKQLLDARIEENSTN
jgi:ATP-binding cassette subfamily B protein